MILVIFGKQRKIEEDEKLINYLFKLKSIKSANITSLKEPIPKDFEEISIELKRSTASVYVRWNQIVIPYLKPHMKQLVSSTNFKKDVLRLIEEIHVKTTTLKGYTKTDDTFIIQQVEKYGYEQETFVKII